ncbi:MAG: rSAM-modified peptide [Candidatus Aminicenantes bacterium]|nr:rSAM-modified peptide [Candidatus Aminicenantes bacterium]
MKSKMKESLNLFKLSERKLKAVKGGHCCCGCLYANSGGSSMLDNMDANALKGLHSPIPICDGTHQE